VTSKKKGEPQYEHTINLMRVREQRLGLSSGWAWYDDPKRLVFSLSRYKFVAQLFRGRRRVLEAGCGDGFYSRIVRQAVDHMSAIDFDSSYIESARSLVDDRWPIEFAVHDLLEGPVPGTFDAVFSLDVLEHIPGHDEHRFTTNLVAPLEQFGVVIIGCPSLESQAYASKQSAAGHVNCKSQDDLRAFMLNYFHTVFMFSMNDEVVHTGFGKMSHYNIALCCEKRTGSSIL